MEKKFEIKGWKFIKLKYFVSKTKRIDFLINHLNFLSKKILIPFSNKYPVKNQLKIRLEAMDAYISTSFWLISETSDYNNKKFHFDELIQFIKEAKQNLIQFPAQNWFDDNQLLKSELVGKEFMSTYEDSVSVLSYLTTYTEHFELFIQNPNKLWLEVVSNKT